MSKTNITVPTRWVMEEGEVFTFWGDRETSLQRGDKIQIIYIASVPYGTAVIVSADKLNNSYMAKRVS